MPPDLMPDEDEAGEGGGAMNESDDEVPEGESN